MAIIVVSGLPRSGTSLMMQMLEAAGIPLLSDGERAADTDNPAGYLEFERVKKIKHDSTWLEDAEQHAVKVVAPLIFELPAQHGYRVIVMRRDMAEILASQKTMLARRQQQGSSAPDAMLAKVFEQQLTKLSRWLTAQANCEFIEVSYSNLLAEPAVQIQCIIDFLQQPLDPAAMANCIDPALYRNKA